jgi:hypothetical protein
MPIYLLIFHASRPELVCYFRAGLPYFLFENSGRDSLVSEPRESSLEVLELEMA